MTDKPEYTDLITGKPLEQWAQQIMDKRDAATQPATSQEGEGKLHRKLRTIYDVLHDIHDRCEDEGDRIYLGSTEDRHTLKRQLRYLEKLIPDALLYPALAATPTPPTLNSWANTPEAEHERILLMAEIELHLKSCRIFLTSREKMHPVGVDIHDELLAKVTAAIEATGSEKAHG